MIEDLNTIYKGKATIIKGNQYKSAKDYIEPFIKKFEKYNVKFICNVKEAEQCSFDEKNIDIVYNKVLIYALFPSNYDITINKETYHKVVCMTYCLDRRKPLCKFYTGIVDTNNNFYTFNKLLYIQEIEPDNALDYSKVDLLISYNNKIEEEMIKQLVSITFNRNNIFNKVGEWVDFTINHTYSTDYDKVKLSTTLPVDVYKAVFIDKGSEFYTEENPSYFLMFKAFISEVTQDEKDINNRFEKALLVDGLFNL